MDLALSTSEACGHYCLNQTTDGLLIETNYARGTSSFIELETLFPRLHTLKLGTTSDDSIEYVDADIFAALPPSLKRLEAPIELRYSSAIRSYFSVLPPQIVHLTGPISWKDEDHPLGEHYNLRAVRLDCELAPQTLETFPTRKWQPWATADDSSSFECWLPKSLLEIDWTFETGPDWTPRLAHTMPPNLHTLARGNFNHELLAMNYTNWVADLPSTLTKLKIVAATKPIDFASYGRFLPPSLTKLKFYSVMKSNRGSIMGGMFGDWKTISGADYWPSNLTNLNLDNFWIEACVIPHLPQSLKKLNVMVAKIYPLSAMPTAEVQDVLDTSQLPPNLTFLQLRWAPSMQIKLALAQFPLEYCRLRFKDLELPLASNIQALPASLTTLKVDYDLDMPTPGLTLRHFLPLTSLSIRYAHIDWFEFLPPALRTFEVVALYGVYGSSLVASGQLFKHLPSSLTKLHLWHGWRDPLDSPNDTAIPAQRFDHLPHLRDVLLWLLPHVSSSIVRNLPLTLQRLKANIKTWNEDDLPYLPPCLKVLSAQLNIPPQLAAWMPLATLAQIKPRDIHNSKLPWKIACRRVREASEVPWRRFDEMEEDEEDNEAVGSWSASFSSHEEDEEDDDFDPPGNVSDSPRSVADSQSTGSRG